MANLNLSEFTEKLFVADADHTFIWDTAASISKRVSRNSWLSGTTADFHLGLADAASPVAQTISVQSVVAGTSNTAGANFSINGSQGTGTGAGGALLLRTAPAGSSGTAQNALVTAVAITSAGNVGIGTTAPAVRLDVTYSNAGKGISLRNTSNPATLDGEAGIDLGFSSSRRLVIGSSANSNFSSVYANFNYLESIGQPLTFVQNSVNVLTLNSGNVGIGTTSPTSKLHVAGSSSPTITIDNTNTTGYSQMLFKNTIVGGDGFWLNGSAQSGYGGPSSFNLYASSGPLAFHTASVTNALSIAQNGTSTHAGHLIFAPDNTYDIGASGANRPRNVYVGNSVAVANSATIGGGAGIIVASGKDIGWASNRNSIYGGDTDGVIRITNYAATDFNRLQFGGTTNLFPAIKRSSTTLQARLADDSAFAPIQGKLTTETAFTATTVTPTGFITLYDSTGAAYKVPCVPA